MLRGAECALSPPREGVAKPARPPSISWNQVDVGKLIESLDADILSSEMGSRENSPPPRPAPLSSNHLPAPRTPAVPFPHEDTDKAGLKMKIKRTKSGRQEIVKTLGGAKSPAYNGNFDEDGVGAVKTSAGGQPPMSSSGGPLNMSGPMNMSGSPMSAPRPVTTVTSSPLVSGGGMMSVKSENVSAVQQQQQQHKPDSNGSVTPSIKSELGPLTNSGLQQLTSKPIKVDAGTLTDASTETEPEILGPCEPGTAVNLEGIVWHETDTGVLVVNITWRGKTYVGTLLDCARHTNQWSAPRFTDSPEPGGKGRGKRGRTNTAPSEPEPRKNLRSSKGKGKGGKGSKSQQQAAAAAAQEEEFNFPAPASPAKDQVKRKKEAEFDESKKRKRTSSDSDGDSSTPPQEEEVKPVLPIKKEPKPLSYSYTMLACPRKECSKQYKHDDGLKWHVSHSHPEFIGADGEIRDSSEVEKEEQERKRKNRSREDKKEREKKEIKQENGEKGTPAKQPKLDDKAATPSTPATERQKPPLSTPQRTPSTPMTPSNPAKPPIYSTPVNNGRLPVSADDLRQKGKLIAELPAIPHAAPPQAHILSNPPPLLTNAAPPIIEREKPPTNSPAYSDISDDGEDSRGKDMKLPQGLPAPPTSHVPSSSFYHHPAPSQPSRSSPHVRSDLITSSLNSTPRSMSYVVPGTNSDPQPGTPEYHKYLAANGFPPFPYPYPVGMDPNYHIQLLKTDPGYKAKWEKDRADRERAFKEQLDKDQGKFSGLSLMKEDRLQNIRKPDSNRPEDLRKREPSGDSRPRSRASPMINTISVKPEFREKEEVKKEVKSEEGVKPTMETRGPPPGPQTFGYMHPSLIRPPYTMSMGPGVPSPFDPIFAGAGMSHLSPYGLPPMGGPSNYLSPAHLSSIRPPGAPFSFADPMMRAPFPLGAADELARAAAAGGPPGISGTKALDLLQQHASQYYANQKLAELQERALKSPSSSLSSHSPMSSGSVGHLTKPITTMAGKDSPTLTLSGDKAKSPPPLRHVHTHTHTHIGLGYPLLPPGSLPPVPGGIPPGPALPPGALPPPPVGVSSVPFSGASPYSGKSPG